MPACDGGTVLPFSPCDAMTSATLPVVAPAASPPWPEYLAPTTMSAMNVTNVSATSFLPLLKRAPFCARSKNAADRTKGKFHERSPECFRRVNDRGIHPGSGAHQMM